MPVKLMKPEFNQIGQELSRLSRSALSRVMRGDQSCGGSGGLAGQGDVARPLGPADVLLGVPAATLLVEDDPSLYPALTQGIKRLAQMGCAGQAGGALPTLADGAGHRRDSYWALVLHLHLAAFGRRYESLPGALWGVCEDTLPMAVGPVRWIEDYATVAPEPEKTAMVLWSALCLFEQATVAGRDADVELVDAVVHQVTVRDGPDGSLHPKSTVMDRQGEQGSLDAWTYRELCGLHALANLAVMRPNDGWAKRVEQIALYHLQHTQPDHTTNQPWGVFGFLWSPRTRIFGLQQIHDASAGGDGGSGQTTVGAVAGMLMADGVVAINTLCGRDLHRAS